MDRENIRALTILLPLFGLACDPSMDVEYDDEWSLASNGEQEPVGGVYPTEHFIDVWEGSGNEEVRMDMGYRWALIAIGGRAKPGEITTLRMLARKINSDGTLGVSQEFRTGTEKDHGLEVWCVAPRNHIIVGVGGRLKDGDLTTMQIEHAPYDPKTKSTTKKSTTARCGIEPHAPLERMISHQVYGYPLSQNYISGISMRELDGNLETLRARFMPLYEI